MVAYLNEKAELDKKSKEDVSVLKGKTLQIYFQMLKTKESIGVRELQRQLNLSSPSLVTYHLNKLEEIGLVDKNREGQYFPTRKANIAELKDLIMFKILKHYITLPKMVLYAIIFSVLYIFFIPIFLFFDHGLISNSFIFANIFGLLGMAIFWYETWLSYRGLPFT